MTVLAIVWTFALFFNFPKFVLLHRSNRRYSRQMKIFHLLLLCVGFAIGGCRLIELGGESFKKTIERDGKRDLWLIEFYAPWFHVIM